MATHAASLSALNELAANPPQYPHNPAAVPHEPLVLYISRVPGTRDIILSTLKPQRKNVTAEDVANALYYVHLDQASDARLAVPSDSRTGASPRSSLDQQRSPASPIQRKPLPPGAAPAAAAAPPTTPPPPPTPAPAIETPPSPEDQPPPPLPPRPQPWVPPGFHLDKARTFSPAIALAVSSAVPDTRHVVPSPRATPAGRTPALRKPLGPRTLGDRDRDHDHSPVRAASQAPTPGLPPPSPRSGRSSPTAAPVPFQLTLIRRDPSTGNQWNIGRVSSMQGIVSGLAPGHDGDRGLDGLAALKGQSAGVQIKGIASQGLALVQGPDYAPDAPAIRILIATSGYAKFRGMPSRQSYESASRDFAAAVARAGLSRDSPESRESSRDDIRDDRRGSADAADKQERDADQAAGVFSRQVVMAYSKSWTAGLRNAFRRHDRSQSEGEPELAHSAAKDQDGAVRDKDTKPRGYVFASPWDGQCEFRTGHGGRSLKLRHSLEGAGAGGGGLNPLVVAQNLRDGQRLAAASGRARAGSLTTVLTGAAPVSELRFNLPSAELWGERDSREYAWRRREDDDDDGSWDDARGSADGPATAADAADTDTAETADAYDATALGREAAGGGNRGKRAKMGKLIIFDEGYKMLDLVVAANVGMWWVSWERSF